jgi:hypothetical protein
LHKIGDLIVVFDYKRHARRSRFIAHHIPPAKAVPLAARDCNTRVILYDAGILRIAPETTWQV